MHLYLCIYARILLCLLSACSARPVEAATKFALKCFSKLLNCFCLSPVDEQENENMKIDIIALTQTTILVPLAMRTLSHFQLNFSRLVSVSVAARARAQAGEQSALEIINFLI